MAQFFMNRHWQDGPSSVLCPRTKSEEQRTKAKYGYGPVLDEPALAGRSFFGPLPKDKERRAKDKSQIRAMAQFLMNRHWQDGGWCGHGDQNAGDLVELTVDKVL